MARARRSSLLSANSSNRASSAEQREHIRSAATTALAQHEDFLRGEMINWPKDCCEEICHAIIHSLEKLPKDSCDLRSLWIRSGWFDSTEASKNDPASPYGNHWGPAHVWIEWRDVIIDPTASQFLRYLPSPLLIATPEMPEHRFYYLERKLLP